LDQDADPAGRKSSCQKVLRGWSSWPMGMVAHVPSEVSTDVAIGVGNEGAAVPAAERALGTPPLEQPPRLAPSRHTATTVAT
jgi:hypothetical protein